MIITAMIKISTKGVIEWKKPIFLLIAFYRGGENLGKDATRRVDAAVSILDVPTARTILGIIPKACIAASSEASVPFQGLIFGNEFIVGCHTYVTAPCT